MCVGVGVWMCVCVGVGVWVCVCGCVCVGVCVNKRERCLTSFMKEVCEM